MTDAHAAQHFSPPAGAVFAAHTFTPPDDSESLGFGTDLRCGTESTPDGDNDTDDIGTYPSLGQFRDGYTYQ
jgi:hypothetical protein